MGLLGLDVRAVAEPPEPEAADRLLSIIYPIQSREGAGRNTIF